MRKLITKVWDWIKCAFWWFIDLFRTRYEVTVSFNKEWGDADDKSYIVKKISVQKEKHLKFTKSSIAKKLLDDWKYEKRNFTIVFPKDFRRALMSMNQKNLTLKKLGE